MGGLMKVYIIYCSDGNKTIPLAHSIFSTIEKARISVERLSRFFCSGVWSFKIKEYKLDSGRFIG